MIEGYEGLLREIGLGSVHIGFEFNDIDYDVFDDTVSYFDDDQGINHVSAFAVSDEGNY